MRLLKFVIAYDGTRFAGWQVQPGHRSVQQSLEEALHRILQEKVRVTGAGRTDAGVHAQGQVAHAAVRSKMPLPALQKSLNAVLPEDVVVHSLTAAPRRFHARYSAKSKHYRYSIWNSPVRPLFDRNFLTHVRDPLDPAKMRRLAAQLQGKRDFRAFHSAGREVANTVRHLKRLTLTKKGPLLQIDAAADGFLYHMVRRITGLLIEAGRGKPLPPVAPTAPAKGLCLMEVRYG
ncbi:MAG: tRNA pseudouridine(38-40) synthase TruA [Candidatus Omnitrophica bacterium]|nr:tRNA pseudouridine(38-40) synthase TruA [Candidatus Omnitrophota bacterium]